MDELVQPIPRTVKPRKTGYTDLPLLAVRKEVALTENGVIGELAAIDWRNMKPVLVIGVNLAYMVAELDQRYRSDKKWQWRARDQEMEIGKVATQARTIVDYFGFKAERDKGHKKNHYHYCLDAFMYYSNTFTLGPEVTDTAEGLMKWAIALRDYCRTENLPMRGTASATAASYLRDQRFYAEPRRKVPRATNANAREALPGNHYQLSLTTRKRTKGFDALEIDQTRAHHYHAEHAPLPDANTLFAFGDFEELREVCVTSPHPKFIGLYHMRLRSPRKSRHPYWSPLRGTRAYRGGHFVFTAELPLLLEMGYEIEGITAGWGSRLRDTGIPAYARHCQQQLDTHDDAAWLKPILLSTYGLLAVRPRAHAAVYRQAETGDPFTLLAGGQRQLHGFLVSHTDGNAIEPAIANVLHRGMIEAATRACSLELAEWLSHLGYWVFQVYADSVIIADDPDKPKLETLPVPWRVKQTLTDYRPINVQAFVSIEKTRMPGTPLQRDDLRKIDPPRAHAPAKQLTEAVSGRLLPHRERRARGIPARHI